MPTVLLVRHGRTGANRDGVLAGRSPGVGLDETGQTQARTLALRLAGMPLAAVVTSPLQRCLETVREVLRSRDGAVHQVDDRLVECEYGDWTGRSLKELARDPLWKVVQAHPSAVRFPGGESLRAVQARAVEAVRDHDTRVARTAGPDVPWVVVSHADVIKAVLADALGLHLDQFQRLVVDPCSVSVVRYTEVRPFVLRLNDTGGDLADLRPPARRRRRRIPPGDAAVGGGAGTA
ncbi:MAG TPA: histidine phosphatase family protein [Jiangellales bacterium]|nr:histidine phosphatase family protein [Jiangellales bacterium]